MSGSYIDFPFVQSDSALTQQGSSSSGSGGSNPPNIGIAGTDAGGNVIDSVVLFGDTGWKNATIVNSGINANSNLGSRSAVFGMSNVNTVAGDGSAVFGNNNNNSSGQSLVGGVTNTVNSNRSLVVGTSNNVLVSTGSSTNNVVGGSSNTLTDTTQSLGLGTNNTVNSCLQCSVNGNSNIVTTSQNTNVNGTSNTVVNALNSDISGRNHNVRGSGNKVSGATNTISAGVNESVIEGSTNSQTNGGNGHIEGLLNQDDGYYNHIEGSGNNVSGTCNVTHVEGNGNVVTACNRAHIEGQDNVVNGELSHTQGYQNNSKGRLSNTSGQGNISRFNQDVSGRFAIEDTVAQFIVPTAGQNVEIVGWGTDAGNRKNIRTLKDDGTETLSGDLVLSSINKSIITNGDTLQICKSQPIFLGNKIYQKVFSKTADDYSNLTITNTAEQVIFDSSVMGRSNKIANFVSNFLLQDSSKFLTDLYAGIYLENTNGTLTFRLKMVNGGTTVVIGDYAVPLVAMGIPTFTACCGKVSFWTTPISYLVPGSNARLRTHNKFEGVRGNTPSSLLWSNETETYSNVDLTISQNLVLTAQFSNAGNSLFCDWVEVTV